MDRELWRNGLWDRNAGLAQLLGLCPLLAVSRSVETGLGLGIATLLVLAGSNLLVSMARRLIDPRVRLPACVLIIAAFVTAADRIFQAWLFPLYQQIGLFLPLIVTNCVILARSEAFAMRNGPWRALQDGLAHGLGFAAVLVALGALRQFAGLAVALLPTGAFIGLALLLAARNRWLARSASRPTPAPPGNLARPT